MRYWPYWLPVIAFCVGHLMGWVSAMIHIRERDKIEQTLTAHRKYIADFEDRHPEYRGTQWGKP